MTKRKHGATLRLHFNGPDNQYEIRAFHDVFHRCFNGEADDDEARDALIVQAAQAIIDLVALDKAERVPKAG
jgi:hypothetical protein